MKLQQNWIEADRRVFGHKKKYIHGAMNGDTGIINGVKEENKEDIFYMLLFCLCVPQSKAIKADEAIDILREIDYYHTNLSQQGVLDILQGRVRFHSVKSKRIVTARSLVIENEDFWLQLKKYYSEYVTVPNEYMRQGVLESSRKYLISKVNGMGMKLASHFLRNIGMSGLAILDVHILDGLKKRGIVSNEDILKLNYDRYTAVEQLMISYAQEVGITVDELDFLLWSQKTGYVFK